MIRYLTKVDKRSLRQGKLSLMRAVIVACGCVFVAASFLVGCSSPSTDGDPSFDQCVARAEQERIAVRESLSWLFEGSTLESFDNYCHNDSGDSTPIIRVTLDPEIRKGLESNLLSRGWALSEDWDLDYEKSGPGDLTTQIETFTAGNAVVISIIEPE